MRRSRRGHEGFATVQYLLALSFSLLALVGLLNFVVFQYGRGAVRAALDEGTRAGSRISDAPVQECQDRARQVLDDLVGGPLGDGIDPVVCAIDGDRIRAETTVEFEPWFMNRFGAWQFTVSAVSVKEEAPQ